MGTVERLFFKLAPLLYSLKVGLMPERQQSKPRIRTARRSELGEVSLLIRDAYKEYERLLSPGDWQAYVQDITDVRSRLRVAELIVAEMDSKPVGAVTLYLPSASPSETGWPEGWAGIRILAVHPSCRGRGIGRALMEKCLRRCRKRGIRTIGLHTTEAMAIARRMYERMGFVRVPQFDFRPRPSVVVMAYRLDL